MPAGASTGPQATLTDGIVTVSGTSSRDVMSINLNANRLAVDFGANGTVDARFGRSLFRLVRVLTAGGNDAVTFTGTGGAPVTISGGTGADFIGVIGNIGELGTDDAPTTVNGNDGNDSVLAATPGAVTIHTGAGNDFVDGGGAGVGHETISLGDGDDRLVSALNEFVGARSDLVNGGTGQDSMQMVGSFASETLNLSAKDGHLLVNLDQIDADNVETVNWLGRGGNDSGDEVNVNDLTGTDVSSFTADFTDPLDGVGPNNSADQLTVRGTPGEDNIKVGGSTPRIAVAGLSPTVDAVNLDRQDLLRIDTLDGRDTVDSSGLPGGLVQLQVI
jgi:hypothetical protein